MRLTILFVIIFAALSHGESVDAVTIETVSIGNAGNAADTRWTNYFSMPVVVGSVPYAYRIGTYEVTAGQYGAFLNAVAKADPNGLYDPVMADPGGSGGRIHRMGSSPNYSYTVADDWANRPVNYVSFWDAARFTNWLHNGQPVGPQGPETTESGAYHDVGNQTLFGRNAGARFFVPTEDEWYKAAYHKNDGVTGNYWRYPTATNTEPINTLPDLGNHANFYDYDGTGNQTYSIGGPYYRTEAGAFYNSASPYGTFDQAGNVWEWNESIVAFNSYRGMRGGSYQSAGGMDGSVQGQLDPTFESSIVGFRVASIEIAGDYNRNGVVDAADYVVWRNKESVAADYDTWRSQFGKSISGNGTSLVDGQSVPEPSVFALLLVGVATALVYSRVYVAPAH